MKIGIVTITQSMNYGQRLQNYAVENVLKSIGADAETVLLDETFLLSKKERAILKINYALKRGNWKTGLRPLKFDSFNKKYLTFSKEKYPSGNFENYDYIICGSDQIWNLTVKVIADNNDFYFANFVPPQKRIAYSASIGTDMIGDENLKTIADYANQMKAVSVRELSSAKKLESNGVKNVYTTIDPVLMISADKWEKIITQPKYVKSGEKFILTYFLGNMSDETSVLVEKISKFFNWRIIKLQGDLYEESDDYRMFSTDPAEFVWLIKNSEIVLTDSFHGCAFASIFRKPFRWYSRNGGTNMNCRIENFFNMFSISEWAIGNTEEDLNNILKCDYSAYEKIIKTEQKKALDYLENAIKKSECTTPKLDTDDCLGCGACALICKKKCIEMTANDEGFLYPKINAELCINCKQCEAVCPLNKEPNGRQISKAFFAENKNEDERLLSSSGGAFLPLARKIIRQNGVVFGAAFNSLFEVEHIKVEIDEDLIQLSGSKYVQSRIGNTYAEAKSILKSGRKVLFSGTGCQIAGLKSYLGKNYDNLYTIDFICHGVPSPVIWKKYLESFKCGLPEKVSFRDKSTGWKAFSMAIDFKNKSYKCKYADDPYMDMFMGNLTLRESCYSCRFKINNSVSDITLADFWGIEKVISEKDDNKGASLAVVNTEKGYELLKAVSSDIMMVEVDYEKSVAENKASYEWPVRNERRDKYLSALKKRNFNYIYNKCYHSTNIEKMKTVIAKLLYR